MHNRNNRGPTKARICWRNLSRTRGTCIAGRGRGWTTPLGEISYSNCGGIRGFVRVEYVLHSICYPGLGSRRELYMYFEIIIQECANAYSCMCRWKRRLEYHSCESECQKFNPLIDGPERSQCEIKCQWYRFLISKTELNATSISSELRTDLFHQSRQRNQIRLLSNIFQ